MTIRVLFLLTIMGLAIASNGQCQTPNIGCLTNGLGDGEYIIERVMFAPSHIFSNEKEAKAWLEAVKKKPELVQPRHDLFRLQLSGSTFVVHQIQTNASGDYVPKGNFFVSCTPGYDWAYEEAANRVTIVTNISETAGGGPVRGILETGVHFCNELRTLGFGIIDAASIKLHNEQITGSTVRGDSFTGAIDCTSQGLITNFDCTISGDSTYRLAFHISYDKVRSEPTQIIMERNHVIGGTMNPVAQYTVLCFSQVASVDELKTEWQRYTNATTTLVYVDATTGKTLIRDKKGMLRPPGTNAVVNLKAQNAVFVRRLILCSLGALLAFGIFITFRLCR